MDNPLLTGQIQACRELSIETYPNRQFRSIDDPDRQFGTGSVPTQTRTQSDGPEPLLTILSLHNYHLQVNIHIHPSKLPRWQPPGASPTHSITAFLCTNELTLLQHPSAVTNELDQSLHVYFSSYSITVSNLRYFLFLNVSSKCIAI